MQETNSKWIAQETLSKEAVEGGYEDVFLEIGYKALICLVEHLFKGVQNYFLELYDDNWSPTKELETNPVGEICNSFNQKFEIFDKLDKKSYERLLNIVKRRTLVDYLTSLMKRRISLTNDDERKKGEGKIREDEGILNEFFTAMNTYGSETQHENNFDVLGFIANIVGADEEMLTFELMTLIRQVVFIIAKTFFRHHENSFVASSERSMRNRSSVFCFCEESRDQMQSK